MDNVMNLRGETIHEYIGTLIGILIGLDMNMEIEKVDRDQIGILLSDAISILNDYK